MYHDWWWRYNDGEWLFWMNVPSTMEVRKTKAWPKFTEKSGKYWRQCNVGTNIWTSDRPIRYPAYKSSSPQADRPDGKTYIWKYFKHHIHILWPWKQMQSIRNVFVKVSWTTCPQVLKLLRTFPDATESGLNSEGINQSRPLQISKSPIVWDGWYRPALASFD